MKTKEEVIEYLDLMNGEIDKVVKEKLIYRKGKMIHYHTLKNMKFVLEWVLREDKDE
jgi:hypothetical protein